MCINGENSTLDFDDDNQLSAYRLCRDSGTLNFWDGLEEDIYYLYR